MRFLIAVFVTATLVSGGALAQQSTAPSDQPPADQSAPAAAAPAGDEAPAAGPERRQPAARRVACREKGRKQGLKGQQLKDSIQLCVEEARVSCTKQAIAKKIPAHERREFMRNCAG